MWATLLQATIDLSLVYVALAIAVSITALSFLLGEFFSMPSVKSFAKVELAELGVTAVIIVIAALLVADGGIFDQVSQGFVLPEGHPNRGVCPDWHGTKLAFGQAHYFLGCMPQPIFTPAPPFLDIEVRGVMLNKLTEAYGSMMVTEMFIGLFSGMSTNVKIPIRIASINVGMTPWIAMVPMNDLYTILVDTVGAIWAAFAAQKVLLSFVEESVLTLFLPFGLLLRAFPFSRKTGSTVIAVVFAAYFIYPTSILINQHVYEMIVNPAPQPGSVCRAVGAACTQDLQCCSRDCRSGSCVRPLQDFSSYESVFAMCELTDSQLESWADEHDSKVLDIYFGGQDSDQPITKTEARLSDGWAELGRKGSAFGGLIGPMFYPLPTKATAQVMRETEVLVIDAMQFTLLGIMFIVIEIVLTMTLMKDFSMLIGGETKILGFSRLV